ncbi:hypothetical protein N2152v2_006818 [Parachlorella kessleri]
MLTLLDSPQMDQQRWSSSLLQAFEYSPAAQGAAAGQTEGTPAVTSGLPAEGPCAAHVDRSLLTLVYAPGQAGLQEEASLGGAPGSAGMPSQHEGGGRISTAAFGGREVVAEDDMNEVTFKTVGFEKTHTVTVSRFATVDSLVLAYHGETGVLPAQVRLIFAGRQLETDRTAADYGVESGDVIHVVMRLRGYSSGASHALPSAVLQRGSSGLAGDWPAAAALEEGAWEAESDEEGDAEAALVAARAAMGALGRCAAAIKQGRWQQAAAEARLAQRLAPQDARGAVAEALAFMAGRQLGPALRCLRHAQEVDPTYPGIQRLALVVESVCQRVRAHQQGPQEMSVSHLSGGAPVSQEQPAADLTCMSTGDPAAVGTTDDMLGQQCLVSESEPIQGGSKFKRLITPPQNDCRKRALLYSRCNSAMDGGAATEGPSMGMENPADLAAMCLETAQPSLLLTTEPTLTLPDAAADT